MPTLDFDSLDEAACRRPTFRTGTPVVLANGQAWHLPTIPHTLRPALDEDGRLVHRLPWDGDLFVALHGLGWAVRLGGTEPGPDAMARFNNAAGVLGECLLRINYQLSPEEAQALLEGGDQGALIKAIVGHCDAALGLLCETMDDPGAPLPSN